MMTMEEYIKSLGFEQNPFQHFNADKEIDALGGYFIAPDYFEDLWGDPANPVSNIIYAPRGGGKTAQRIMIEKRALETKEVLTITYTNHDLSAFKKIEEVDINYHLVYLNRLLLLAFFNRLLDHDFNFDFTFTFTERQYIYKIARVYLYDTPASFPNQAYHSLKKVEDYAVDIWKGFKEPIVNVIQQITKSKSGVELDLSKVELDKKLQQSHRDNFRNIVQLLNKAGYSCIYVLVDKVDEQSLTGNNSEDSFLLIKDLIKDLELLELEGISFKFFLWDALRQFASVAARPDRVFSYDLNWNREQIRDMLNKRTQYYSNNTVTSFSSLFESPRLLGRVILFSELSPRDCVRICNRIISEQFKADPAQKVFREDIVNRAIEHFCREKASELITNSTNLKHLTKTKQVSFTIEELVQNQVASDTGAVRNIINPWTNGDFARKIGTVTRKGAKAVNEYAFQDVRLAFMACPTMGVQDFLDNKVRQCKVATCKTIFYRDFDRKAYACPNCNTVSE